MEYKWNIKVSVIFALDTIIHVHIDYLYQLNYYVIV